MGKIRRRSGKNKEEKWEKKERNLREFSSNLCQGLPMLSTVSRISISIAMSPHFILSMQSMNDKITKVSLIRLQDKFEDSENSKTSFLHI